MVGSDPEVIGLFTNSLITYRALIWDNMVDIFQGTYTWSYLKLFKKHRDGRMGYKLIYDNRLGPGKIDNMAAGAKNNLAQCIYNEEKRNCTFEKYYTLHKEHHNILESLIEHGYTDIYQI